MQFINGAHAVENSPKWAVLLIRGAACRKGGRHSKHQTADISEFEACINSHKFNLVLPWMESGISFKLAVNIKMPQAQMDAAADAVHRVFDDVVGAEHIAIQLSVSDLGVAQTDSLLAAWQWTQAYFKDLTCATLLGTMIVRADCITLRRLVFGHWNTTKITFPFRVHCGGSADQLIFVPTNKYVDWERSLQWIITNAKQGSLERTSLHLIHRKECLNNDLAYAIPAPVAADSNTSKETNCMFLLQGRDEGPYKEGKWFAFDWKTKAMITPPILILDLPDHVSKVHQEEEEET